VFFGGDYHCRFPGPKGVTDKSAQFIEKKPILSVKLNYVRRMIVVGPIGDWGERCSVRK
jgi:hypothetical protein